MNKQLKDQCPVELAWQYYHRQRKQGLNVTWTECFVACYRLVMEARK